MENIAKPPWLSLQFRMQPTSISQFKLMWLFFFSLQYCTDKLAKSSGLARVKFTFKVPGRAEIQSVNNTVRQSTFYTCVTENGYGLLCWLHLWHDSPSLMLRMCTCYHILRVTVNMFLYDDIWMPKCSLKLAFRVKKHCMMSNVSLW